MSRSLHTHAHTLLTYDASLTAMKTYNTYFSQGITSIALRCKTLCILLQDVMMRYTLQINDCEVTHMPEANIHWCREDSQSVSIMKNFFIAGSQQCRNCSKVSRMQRGVDLRLQSMAGCPAAGSAASATVCQWLKKRDPFSKLVFQKHSQMPQYHMMSCLLWSQKQVP